MLICTQFDLGLVSIASIAEVTIDDGTIYARERKLGVYESHDRAVQEVKYLKNALREHYAAYMMPLC